MWSHTISFPDKFQAKNKKFDFTKIKIVFLSGMAVGGVSNVVLSTIEKRFQFSSKEAGFIAASNDISAVLLTSFVSFYGGCGRKPKRLGCGALLTGTCKVILS